MTSAQKPVGTEGSETSKCCFPFLALAFNGHFLYMTETEEDAKDNTWPAHACIVHAPSHLRSMATNPSPFLLDLLHDHDR